MFPAQTEKIVGKAKGGCRWFAHSAQERTAIEKVGQVLPVRKFWPTGNTRPLVGELHSPEFARFYRFCRGFRRGV